MSEKYSFITHYLKMKTNQIAKQQEEKNIIYEM